MPTVRDLVSEPSFALELVVGGDLDRDIRWVHVTELLDASRFLVGAELVLTAGVWRRQRRSAEEFVAALESRHPVAIGYGLVEDGERVPPTLTTACLRHGIPLVVVPIETPFIAISQWFVAQLAQARELDRDEERRWQGDLLDAAGLEPAGAALSQVASMLRHMAGRPVNILDETGHVLARSGRPLPRDVSLPTEADTKTSTEGWSFFPVGARSRACIAVETESDDVHVDSRILAARPIVGLILARERAVRENERRLAGEVVWLLLANNPDAAKARMPYYGLDPSKPLVALACSTPEPEGALSAAERWLESTKRAGVVSLRESELVVALAAEALTDRDVRNLAEDLTRAVSATSTGIGPIAPDIVGARVSLVHARRACDLGRRRGGGIVVSYQDETDYTVLLALQDPTIIENFREALLGPLLAYDEKHHSELVPTVRTFLEYGGRWQETADALHIHVNTLRHRITRLEQISGRTISSTPDRVDLWLALEAHISGH